MLWLFEHLCPRDKTAIGLTCKSSLGSFDKFQRRKLYHNSIPSEFDRVRKFVVKMNLPSCDLKQMTHLIWTSNPIILTLWPDLDRLRVLCAAITCGSVLIQMPPNLEHLRIRSDGNLTLVLPNSLLVLHVSNCLVIGLENHPNLTSLVYKHPDVVEDFYMPPNLTMLKLPPTNQLGEFPQSLQVLIFDADYNFPVNSLPPKLTKWNCGFTWNHPLPDLPSSITELEFGHDFSHKITTLPKNTKTLTLHDGNTDAFLLLLHSQEYPELEQLHIHADLQLFDADVKLISKQLPKLRFLSCRQFSESLTALDQLDTLWMCDVGLGRSMNLTNLSKLRTLIILFFVKPETDCDIVLPPSLETFHISETGGELTEFWVTLHLNDKLKSLYTAGDFPTFIIDKLPAKLKSLEIDGNAFLSIPLPLPRSLTSLQIVNYEEFDQDLGVLPFNLEVFDVPTRK